MPDPAPMSPAQLAAIEAELDDDRFTYPRGEARALAAEVRRCWGEIETLKAERDALTLRAGNTTTFSMNSVPSPAGAIATTT